MHHQCVNCRDLEEIVVALQDSVAALTAAVASLAQQVVATQAEIAALKANQADPASIAAIDQATADVTTQTGALAAS